MDVKQNIQKAVEDGGFVDLRRIQKANSQLEYQPNLTQFLGGGTGIELQKEPFETQEYKDMMRKQRDTDSKSDRLVSSSMNIFKKYTEVSETIEEKVKKLRQNNKYARDNQRNSINSTEIMPVESELKKKQFVFPSQRRGDSEGEYQRINSRSMMRDESDSSAIPTVERSQRGGSIIQSRTNNNGGSISQQMTMADQQFQGQTTPSGDAQEKIKFDFHQINSKVQLKKRENVINKQIGNLPRDIQAISDIQEDIKDEKQTLNSFSAEDTFDRSKVDWVSGDVTEAFSIAYVFPKNSIQKSTHNLFFYRDLAPISRFLMKFSNLNGKEQQMQYQKYSQGISNFDANNNNNTSNNPNQSMNNNNSTYNNNFIDQTSNAELIQQDEIAFNVRELSYSNVSDVISGRIVEDQLAKYDNNVLTIDELPLRIQQKVQELIKVSIDAQLKALPILQVSASSARLSNQDDSIKNFSKNTGSNSPEKNKPPQTMSKEQIRNAIKQKQHSDQSSQIDQPLMQSPTGMSLSKLNSQTDLSPEQRKTQAELLQLHGQTDQILNRIGEIKSRKDDLKFIKDTQDYVANYKELKKELQSCLNGLLFMILKTDINPNPSVTSKNSDIELQVSQLLQNLDKIQGTKTTDGHLKSALLLTFLEEYKWIKQEDQLNKMDFDTSFPSNNKDNMDSKSKGNNNGGNSNNNNSNSNTFANFYHNGQDKKAGSRTTAMNSYLNSGLGTPQSNSQQQQQSANTKNTSRFNGSSNSKSPNQQTNAKENMRVSENALDNNRSRSDLQKKSIMNKNKDNNKNLNSSSNNQDQYARKQSYGGQNNSNNNQSSQLQRSVSPNNTTNNSSGGWNIQRMSTTHSYIEQTPQKGNNYNNQRNSNISPIGQRQQQQQLSMQQSASSSMLRHNASTRSISPISASRKSLRVGEKDERKNILQTANIPGIKRGQNSEINKSYLLERSVSPTLQKRK